MISNKLAKCVEQRRETEFPFSSYFAQHHQQQYDDGLITMFHKSSGILSEKFILDACAQREFYKPLNQLQFT